MIHLDKLPTELFYLLATSLTAFELVSLLIVCPRRVSFHQLRRGCYASTQDRFVGLIQALCAGELELVQRIPQLAQLLHDFDSGELCYASHNKVFFGGNEPLAKSVAKTKLSGYINPLVVAINQSSNWPPEQRLRIIQHLLDNGAQTNTWDQFQGRTPLYVATENMHSELVSLLLQYGACQGYISRIGKRRWSPLDAAVEQNHMELVMLLVNHHGLCQSRPFHIPALKRRVRSMQSMVILNMLITRIRYRITDEQLLKVIRWMFPNINLPSRRSRTPKDNRAVRVPTTSSAEPLIAYLRSENFTSERFESMAAELACYTDTISDLQ